MAPNYYDYKFFFFSFYSAINSSNNGDIINNNKLIYYLSYIFTSKSCVWFYFSSSGFFHFFSLHSFFALTAIPKNVTIRDLLGNKVQGLIRKPYNEGDKVILFCDAIGGKWFYHIFLLLWLLLLFVIIFFLYFYSLYTHKHFNTGNFCYSHFFVLFCSYHIISYFGGRGTVCQKCVYVNATDC